MRFVQNTNCRWMRKGAATACISGAGDCWGGTRKDPDRSVLQVTFAVPLRGIPDAAHAYVVIGRTLARTRKAAS